MSNLVLNVKHLRVQIHGKPMIRPVDDLCFSIEAGKTLAIVGESGCGKSITALALMQLLPPTAHLVEQSEIWVKGDNIAEFSEQKLWNIRGQRISMIFQDPMLALNPVMSISAQLKESLLQNPKNKTLSSQALHLKMLDLLAKVRIPDQSRILNEYPHALSGGMKQRVMIAMALACEPDVLIADEPTTALDVTTQAQVLSLMQVLQKESNTAILLITHDLGVVAQMADHVGVMYAGHFIEYKNNKDFFENPEHPYSRLLLQSLPELNKRNHFLPTIEGSVPPLSTHFKTCRFINRCPKAKSICQQQLPEWGHGINSVRCLLFKEFEQFSILNNNQTSFSLQNKEAVGLMVRNLNVHYPIKKGLLKRKNG